MKKSFFIILMLIFVLSSVWAMGEGEKNSLVISTWGFSEDILKSDIYDPFMKETGIDVVLDLGGTSSRYTKYATNKNSGIDVIELSQSYTAQAYNEGLLEPLDYTKINNYNNLIPAAKKIAEKYDSIPFVINGIGIIYDKEAVGFEIKDYDDLWDPRLKNSIVIPEITTTFGPAMVYMASLVAHTDIKSDNAEAAFRMLETLKPNIVKTYSKSSDVANMFAAKEVKVAIVGEYAINMIQKANKDAIFIYPDSGTFANYNTIAINPNSKNKSAAYDYINYRISKALQERTAKSLNEAPVNKNVILDEETKKNKTYAEVAEKANNIDDDFVNKNKKDWIDRWNRLLNQ